MNAGPSKAALRAANALVGGSLPRNVADLNARTERVKAAAAKIDAEFKPLVEALQWYAGQHPAAIALDGGARAREALEGLV